MHSEEPLLQPLAAAAVAIVQDWANQHLDGYKVNATYIQARPEVTWAAFQSRLQPQGSQHNSVSWEILPKGQNPFTGNGNSVTTNERTAVSKTHLTLCGLERALWFDSQTPIRVWQGLLGKRRYLVLEFEIYIVAACGDWGNALYTIANNGVEWKAVFSRSKAEALALGAHRIIHKGDWQARVAPYCR